jgi:crotonobetainyl-CoA:carnitine CoA-transferase CaiB-like acyl-CoA transferase
MVLFGEQAYPLNSQRDLSPSSCTQTKVPMKTSTTSSLPLTGIKVVEFTHMVMGPTCGMVLADMGAQVIKVEPIEGDRTRHLLGSGAGFFPLFNRNKQSICLDLRQHDGAQIARDLCAQVDVVIENFKPGTLNKYSLDYASLKPLNPGLIYASLKGFLPGPYEHRTALDEVVQMMGGLAYMTGRPGDPLRAGSSVNDIMGGMFGAIGILAAIVQRRDTGRGQEVQSALFENNVFLVSQHMMQYAITGQPAAPMPDRISAWAVYDVFTVKGGEQIFLAAVSDAQWQSFCDILGFADLKADPRYNTNNERVTLRSELIGDLRSRLANFSARDLSVRFEAAGLPFAPITKPEELFDDPHLNATGALAEVRLTDGLRKGQTARAALFPFTMNGQRFGVRTDPPHQGEQTDAILREAGLSDDTIIFLRSKKIVR